MLYTVNDNSLSGRRRWSNKQDGSRKSRARTSSCCHIPLGIFDSYCWLAMLYTKISPQRLLQRRLVSCCDSGMRTCLNKPVTALVKFLVGLFLLRICSQQRWQKITIWSLLGVVGVFNAFYLFIVIFQCIPVEYYWFRYTDPQVIDGTCNKTSLATIPTYISLFLNVFADWLLALLPVSFVYKSKMPLKTKCSVVAVLALGSMCVYFYPHYLAK
jgi:hypothetical protein